MNNSKTCVKWHNENEDGNFYEEPRIVFRLLSLVVLSGILWEFNISFVLGFREILAN